MLKIKYCDSGKKKHLLSRISDGSVLYLKAAVTLKVLPDLHMNH